jgi:alkanesulfonate monooxygenase SsuD/methylene tetrahydromethanopterin reductase-like flavin-dependent oxidoreductase (luciferase family)
MVEALSISGTPQECRDKLRSIGDYGITAPIIRVSVQHLAEKDRRQAFLDAIQALKPMSDYRKK